MKVVNEEITRCYLTDNELETLISASDIIKHIKLVLRERSFGEWTSAKLRSLCLDIEWLVATACREDALHE